jgi:hypothetical protein
MEKYIGNQKVLAVVEIAKEEMKTPAGQEFVSVSFEDGTKEVMPKMRYELIVSDTISDASKVQEKIKSVVGTNLFGALHEFGIKFGEIDGVVDACVNLANAGFRKAQDIMFNFTQPEIPLNVINKILIEDHAKQNSNGVGSKGSGADSSDSK